MTKEPKTCADELIQLPDMNLPEPAVVGAQISKVFKTMFTKIEQEIKDTPVDLSTRAGREKIASLAYKIARTKTGLDNAAANLTADQKAIIDKVNEERRTLRETLDGLRDKAREPLTKWEAAESERKESVANGIHLFSNIKTTEFNGKTVLESNSEELQAIIAEVSGITLDKEIYLDQLFEVEKMKVEALQALSEMHVAAVKNEAEQAELVELRQRQAQREEADRVAQEAAAKKAQDEAAERERAENAERLAAKAKERADAEAQAKIDEANQRAIDAEAKAKADADAAIVAEKARVEAERAAEEKRISAEKEAEELRAADLQHRKKINNAVLDAIISSSEVTPEQGKMIVQAIASGKVPHTTIKY